MKNLGGTTPLEIILKFPDKVETVESADDDEFERLGR